jgi:hypothetical protein
MKKIYFLFLFLLVNCVTTIAPGIIFNSTEEHVYPNRGVSYLGQGMISKRVESCTYHSFLIDTFLRVRPSSLDSLLKEYKIKKLGVVDHSSYSFFGPLFYRNCFVIWGELE